MKGLILKDIYNMAKSFKFFLLVILIYGGISYFNGSGAFLTFMIILISMMVPITALSTDEKDQWDVLGLTMPVTPLTMVGEKFLLVLACCVIGLGGGLAVRDVYKRQHNYLLLDAGIDYNGFFFDCQLINLFG